MSYVFNDNTLMDRFISVKRGFTLFSRLGYLEKGLDLWYKVRRHWLLFLSSVSGGTWEDKIL